MLDFFLGPKDLPTEDKDVDKELFLWSVITGRRDFAMLFWSRGGNKLGKEFH